MKDSQVITISVGDPDQQRAVLIANTIATTFQEDVFLRKNWRKPDIHLGLLFTISGTLSPLFSRNRSMQMVKTNTLDILRNINKLT